MGLIVCGFPLVPHSPTVWCWSQCQTLTSFVSIRCYLCWRTLSDVSLIRYLLRAFPKLSRFRIQNLIAVVCICRLDSSLVLGFYEGGTWGQNEGMGRVWSHFLTAHSPLQSFIEIWDLSFWIRVVDGKSTLKVRGCYQMEWNSGFIHGSISFRDPLHFSLFSGSGIVDGRVKRIWFDICCWDVPLDKWYPTLYSLTGNSVVLRIWECGKQASEEVHSGCLWVRLGATKKFNETRQKSET